MSPGFDHEFDVVVVGSGAAGMVCAIAAARKGLRPLIIEKQSVWGGSTALSGGGIWIPGNRLQREAGIPDSPEDAAAFFKSAITDEGPVTSDDRIEAYVRNGPAMIDMLIGEGVKWAADVDHSDYRAELPLAHRGRNLDSEFFDAKKLGPMHATMRRSPAPVAVRLRDLPLLGRGVSSLASKRRGAYIVLRDKLARMIGQDPVGCGQSLAAQLMHVVQKLAIPVWLDTPLKELILEGRRAVGAVVERDGRPLRIAARHAVMLGAGGFARAPEYRERMQQRDGTYSEAPEGDTGDAIRLADGIGAMTAMLNEAWWGPVSWFPGANGDRPGTPVFMQWERSLPHSLVVNEDASRFENESKDYYQFAATMWQLKVEPAWVIIDRRHRDNYVFAGIMPGRTPQAMIDCGYFRVADTIEELATQCGLDPAALRATIDRFNTMARAGKDSDFGRGETAYDRMWGDPKYPNPNLGTIEQGPFYATPIYVGDIGTKGGLVTNAHAQVLDTSGVPIEGLYAAGNTTASLTGRSYPGPGVTLGPAMTFGYLAAQHIAGRARN